jgi:hypothetical protein
MSHPRFCAACGSALTASARFCASCGAPVTAATAATSSGLDSEVRQLLQSGQMIEAVKLVRERTGLGLKEAKDRVDAVAAGLPPGSDRRSRSGAGGCLGCLAVIVAGVLLLLAMFTGLIRLSGAYDQALALARAEPRILKALGEPISASPFTMGTIASGGGRWQITATVYLSGPKGKGTLRLRATTLRGYRDRRWDQFSVFEYHRGGEPYEIELYAREGANDPR